MLLCAAFSLAVLIMASGGRCASLDQLAAEAGAGPAVVDYLKARSLYHIPTLALVAGSEDEFERRLFGPYKAGFVKDGYTHQPADERLCSATSGLRPTWPGRRR